MTYRPWGSLDWILGLSSRKDWHFIGAIGTTERSLCSWALFKQIGSIRSELFAQIDDVDSEKYRDITRAELDARLQQFARIGGDRNSIQRFHIMAELFQILDFARRCVVACPSVVLDITSFPKRYFFPMLRCLLHSNDVKNLLVTYASAASYTDNGPLYEDIEPWNALPGFSGTMTRNEHWIVSIGFLVESFRQYLGHNPDHERMKLLIPHPAPLAMLRRTLESVARLEGGPLESSENRPRFEKFRVDTLDMSCTFDRIASLARDSQKPTAFAPFGPKPTSAAMCLYASQQNSAVYYPQPTVYHPRYAMGIRGNDPLRAVNAYWIKHEGENLYLI